MHTKRFLLYICLISVIFSCRLFQKEHVTTKTARDKNGFTYEYVSGDPLGVRIYTLDNGLTVYLSVNRDEPRIQTYIAVRAGSKSDPAETTGLAHYLEHMMFKGTSKLGTLDWEQEEPLLEKIADLYELHRQTSDPARKKEIYQEIDTLSGEAATFAIPNEYDKMTTLIGAKHTNAHTWVEETVYHNDIPANELERWLTLERERFGELVLRLFHTELEAVYEEFNMYQDNDQRRLFAELMGLLFPTHPYGQQTTIGTAEHLKNPSMRNIKQYWETWYAPNNMAICLVGDLDPEKTILQIDKHWGDLEPNNSLSEVEFPPEEPITTSVSKTIQGPSSQRLSLAFRFDNVDKRGEQIISIIDMILNNRQAGLIDLNLIHQQKVLEAYSHPEFYADYSFLYMGGVPVTGQSLESLRDLLLDQIEMIKQGQFEEWLIDAVINDLALHQMKQMESNRGRAYEFVKTYILGNRWQDQVSYLDELETITREEIIEFTRANFNNWVLVFKEQGQDNSLIKVDKPQITPIQINRDAQSAFYNDFIKIKPDEVVPQFVDYVREIDHTKVDGDIPLYSITNTTNQRASLSYVWQIGKEHDRNLELALEYLDYLGTATRSAVEFKQELYRLGLSLEHEIDGKRLKITLKGLDKSLQEGIVLLESLLLGAEVNRDAYDELVSQIIEKRQNKKSDKRSILDWAMVSYAKYGKNSPFRFVPDEAQLHSLDPVDLAALIHGLLDYQYEIHYYGTRKGAKLKSIFPTHTGHSDSFKEFPVVHEFKEIPQDKPIVYFVHYDMVQTELLFLSRDELFSADLMAYGRLYNEYYGSGLSSVIYQEIRESRALAYSAYSFYSVPARNDKSHYTYAYIGTQADKLMDAATAMRELLSNMQQADSQFDGARHALLNRIANERVTKEKIFLNWLTDRDRGLTEDSRKKVYMDSQEIDFDDIALFFNDHIKSDTPTLLVLGNRDLVDLDALSQFGTVTELSLETIFGY